MRSKDALSRQRSSARNLHAIAYSADGPRLLRAPRRYSSPRLAADCISFRSSTPIATRCCPTKIASTCGLWPRRAAGSSIASALRWPITDKTIIWSSSRSRQPTYQRRWTRWPLDQARRDRPQSGDAGSTTQTFLCPGRRSRQPQLGRDGQSRGGWSPSCRVSRWNKDSPGITRFGKLQRM